MDHMKRVKSKDKQKGVAAIVAILIAALAASTAAFIIWQQSLWVRQLENVTERSKIDQLAKYAIDLARDRIKKDKHPASDSASEWEQPISTSIDEITVNAKITDAQSQFNINSLVQTTQQGVPPTVNDDALKAFKRLLHQLKLDEKLADNALNWIQDSPGNADMDYINLSPPYRTGQRKFVDASELVRVKDFTEPVMHTLLPFVTAFAGDAPVNINTAPEELLAALFDDESIATQIISKRASNPIESIQEIQLPNSSGNTNACNGCYDVKSNYFILKIQAKGGKLESGYDVLINRSGGQWPSVEWQKEIVQ